ncbi:MAG: hypothetical protein U9R21_07735 [Candidatus Thermoplasmatota archaeon]|nr:hypothetical protein [Candidatus Thermoplasmatota archaeon]
MSEYDVNIKRLLEEGKKGNIKTEIWAEITNLDTGKTMKKRIWWKDDDGVFHDGTSKLPVEFRDAVDNAWIEKSRRW